MSEWTGGANRPDRAASGSAGRAAVLLALLATTGAASALAQNTTAAAHAFDRFVGRYQFAPAVHLTVTRRENRLFGEITGQPLFELFADSDTTFVLETTDAQFVFEADGGFPATAVLLRRSGQEQRARRIAGSAVMPKEISLPPDVLDRYVGHYQIGPGVMLRVTRQNRRLFVEAPGAPALEAFASAEREFFHKDVDVQLTFEVTDQRGPATAVIVRQGGRQQRVERGD